MQFMKSYSSLKPRLNIRHNIIGDPELNLWLSAPDTPSYSSDIKNNRLTISSEKFKKGTYGISYGDYNLRKDFEIADGNLEIPLKDITFAHPEAGIGSLWISQNEMLPVQLLLTSGDLITEQKESFVLRTAKFRRHSPVYDVASISDYTPYLNLANGADITVHSLTGITSESGIRMQKGSTLKLTAESRVTFENDNLENGASLTVEAKETVLKPGFSVAKGGTLLITAK